MATRPPSNDHHHHVQALNSSNEPFWTCPPHLTNINNRTARSVTRIECHLTWGEAVTLPEPHGMSSIYLYAEVLLNIHQVTLHASLQTTRNEQTKIEISSDKHVITVFHDGQSTSLYLPTQISGNAKITIPAEKKKDLSVRLAIEDTSGLAPPELNGASDVAPWSAQSMSEDAMLRCKSCHAQILSHCQWQDLPSQNWFEMLDYWHCHKPEDDADHQQGDISSANQPLGRDMTKSKPGLGLVDVVSFLLNAKDCSNLNVSTLLYLLCYPLPLVFSSLKEPIFSRRSA